MLENLNLDSFSEHLNTKFRVYVGGDDTVELELVEARDIGSNARQERFTILFLGPLDAPLEQRMYKMDHEKLGPLDLFIVPVGAVEAGMQYEAVFNRVPR